MQDLTSNAFTVIICTLIVGMALIFLLRKRRITFDIRFHYQEDRNGKTDHPEDREVPIDPLIKEQNAEETRGDKLP